MNLFTPAEYTASYATYGETRARRPAWHLLVLGILAGFFIAVGGSAANMAVHGLTNPGIAKLVSGLIFPFGLVMVILTGAELFTGDVLMSLSLKENLITARRMLWHWLVVFIGNAIGAVAVAAACAFFGQMDASGGNLAVYTIKVAATKSAISPLNAFVMGVLCNILVTVAVLISLGAKDVAGRAVGAYMPIAFFVICGFEHSIANLYYGPAGLLAMHVDKYAKLAADAGIATDKLTWLDFITQNLIPVTLGNTLGGLVVGAVFWWCHVNWKGTPVDQAPASR